MYSHIFLVFGLGMIMGAPARSNPHLNGTTSIGILKDSRSPPNSNGSYSYDIRLADGTSLKQSGQHSDDDGGLVIMGEYEFKDPQGMVHKVSYVADKNGFQPQTGQKSNANATIPEEKPLDKISSSLFSSVGRDF